MLSASFSSSSSASTRPTFQSMFSHMASAARVIGDVFLAAGPGVAASGRRSLNFSQNAIRHLHRRVRRVERQVAEERVVAVRRSMKSIAWSVRSSVM